MSPPEDGRSDPLRSGAAGTLREPPILIATRSPAKLREICGILAGAPLRLVGLADLDFEVVEPDEPHETFLGNALHKARQYAAATGLAVIADDSGLCVDALGGEPGVRSRRFAGATGTVRGMDAGREVEEPSPDRVDQDRRNNELLLERLRGVPAARRGAHHVCVAACVRPERGGALIGVGTVSGRIVEEPHGSGGFGYDPLFLVPQDGRTFAEMSDTEKRALSHRGRAFRALAAVLT